MLVEHQGKSGRGERLTSRTEPQTGKPKCSVPAFCDTLSDMSDSSIRGDRGGAYLWVDTTDVVVLSGNLLGELDGLLGVEGTLDE